MLAVVRSQYSQASRPRDAVSIQEELKQQPLASGPVYAAEECCICLEGLQDSEDIQVRPGAWAPAANGHRPRRWMKPGGRLPSGAALRASAAQELCTDGSQAGQPMPFVQVRRTQLPVWGLRHLFPA